MAGLGRENEARGSHTKEEGRHGDFFVVAASRERLLLRTIPGTDRFSLAMAG